MGWRNEKKLPQGNGKIERWHQFLKQECIRPGTPLSLEDARRLVAKYVEHYNNKRLHSALGYVTPKNKMAGRRPFENVCAPSQKLIGNSLLCLKKLIKMGFISIKNQRQ